MEAIWNPITLRWQQFHRWFKSSRHFRDHLPGNHQMHFKKALLRQQEEIWNLTLRFGTAARFLIQSEYPLVPVLLSFGGSVLLRLFHLNPRCKRTCRFRDSRRQSDTRISVRHNCFCTATESPHTSLFLILPDSSQAPALVNNLVFDTSPFCCVTFCPDVFQYA